MNETTFYIFNENGMIKEGDLEEFCMSFLEKTSFNFDILEKREPLSTIYKKFINELLELILFDHGYVMKVEGKIGPAINLLLEIDSVLHVSVAYYVSPSQRIENSKDALFPRGATKREIAVFLDTRFNNNEYTKALANS